MQATYIHIDFPENSAFALLSSDINPRLYPRTGRAMFKMYLIVMCAIMLMSGMDCSKFINKRVTVLEMKVSALNLEMFVLETDYQDVKANLTQLSQDPANDACQSATESDSYKVEEKDHKKTSDVDSGFYSRLLDAFKAEKQQRIKLEKSFMERIELQLNQQTSLLEELSNVKQKLADTERKLGSFATKQGVKDLSNTVLTMQGKLHDCKTETTKIKEILDETVTKCTSDVATIKQDMKDDNVNTNNKIHDLTQTLANGKVSFSARLSYRLQHLKSYETVIFDIIVNNEGDAYNTITGEFTAPRHGVYVFYTHILSSARTMEMCIRKNNIKISLLYSKGVGLEADSNMVVLELLAGDKINVAKHGPYGEPPFYVHPSWSSFSGFLLYSV